MTKQVREMERIWTERAAKEASEANPGPPGIATPKMERTRPRR